MVALETQPHSYGRTLAQPYLTAVRPDDVQDDNSNDRIAGPLLC